MMRSIFLADWGKNEVPRKKLSPRGSIHLPLTYTTMIN